MDTQVIEIIFGGETDLVAIAIWVAKANGTQPGTEKTQGMTYVLERRPPRDDVISVEWSFRPATIPYKVMEVLYEELEGESKHYQGLHENGAVRPDHYQLSKQRGRPLPYRQSLARAPGWSTEIYEYEPLDHEQQSLRLIKVLPTLSQNGLIQCEMVHASLEARYTCLSYVWGPAKKRYEIFINGRIYNVQHNLWSFLWIAGLKYPNTLFWIDALSIAQQDIEERNHQVMQMGRIYSHAREVIAWLGSGSSLVAFFRIVDAFRTSEEDFDDPVYWRKRYIEVSNGYERFVRLEYWGRAWITQEILLARRLTFLAHEAEVEVEILAEFMDMISLRPHGYLERLWNGLQSNQLLDLLHTFQQQNCTVERDKVYSLLSLCEEGESFMVDYDTSEMSFVDQIMRVCCTAACLCSSTLLAATLSVFTPPLSEFLRPIRAPFLEVDIQERQISQRRDIEGGIGQEGEAPECEAAIWTCAGCGKDMIVPREADCQRIICLADICSINKTHILCLGWKFDGTHVLHSLQDNDGEPTGFSTVAGGIYERDRKEHGSVTLGFTLAALLSKSWCCDEDQSVSTLAMPSTRRYELCERAQRGQTNFRICRELPSSQVIDGHR